MAAGTASSAPELRPGHLVHHFLRSCADACRFNRLLRGADSSPYEDVLGKADDLLYNIFGNLISTTLPSSAWRQVSMPLRMGGHGIKAPGSRHLPARITALATHVTSGSARVGAPDYVLDTVSLLLPAYLQVLQGHMGASSDPVSTWLADPAKIKGATDEHCSKQWCTDPIEHLCCVPAAEGMIADPQNRGAGQPYT